MRLNAKQVRRAAVGCSVLVAAILAASCGGGEPVTTFNATRIIAFGDETSVIDDNRGDGNGRKYSVNATVSDTDATIACTGNPLWIQALATNFGGLVFPQCNPGPTLVTSPTSRIRASFGARAADLPAQIDAQLAESGFQPTDLATVLVGANDVLAEYAFYPAVSEVQITADVTAAGTLVGQQVNRLADAGAKVVISTIPDVGYSPYALAEKAAHIDTDRQLLILRLTAAFNSALRAAMVNDGRRVGLVLMDEYVGAVAKFPGLNGITNATTGACDLSQSRLVPPSILDCTTRTLIVDASAGGYLWADDRHLSYSGQLGLGNLAVQRARNNPF